MLAGRLAVSPGVADDNIGIGDEVADDRRALLELALRTFPQARSASIAILEQALPADPAAIGALLQAAKRAPAAGTA